MLAPDGTLQDKYAYRAFGLATQTTGTDNNPYTFGGKQGYRQDSEYGLYFLRARYYDPVSARFVGRDPDGFAAGDANLFRYVFNDPLNHTDPSGKRVLVPANEIETTNVWGTVTSTQFPCSGTNDILSSEIQSAYQEQPLYTDKRLRFSQWSKVKGYWYGVVDLIDNYSNDVWGKIRNSTGVHLSDLLIDSGNEDTVISARPGPSLNWSPPQESWTYWLSQTAENFAAAIAEVGSSGIQGLTQGLAQAVQRIVLAGLAALLDQVRQFALASFRPDDFLNLFNQFNRIADLAVAIISDPLGFAGNVGQVLQTGVENFFKRDTLAMYLKQGLFQWATKGLTGITIPTDWNLTNTVSFALSLMGITVPRVLGLAAKHPGANVVGAVIQAYNLLSKAGAFLAEIQQGLTFDQLVNMAVDVGKNLLIQTIPQLLFDVLQTFLPGTSVIKAGLALYRSVQWVIGQLNTFAALLSQLVTIVESLLTPEGIATAAQKVTALLGNLLSVAIDFLVSQFPALNNLRAQAIQGIMWLQAQVEQTLDKALAALAKQAQNLLGINSAATAVLPPGQATDPMGQPHVWQATYSKLTLRLGVLVNPNPPSDARIYFEGLLMNPTAQQNPALKMILNQASPLLTHMTKLDGIYQAADAAATALQAEPLASKNANAPPADPTGARAAALAAGTNSAPDLTATEQQLANLYLQALQLTGTSCSIGGSSTKSAGVKAGACFTEWVVANFARGRETMGQSRVGRRMQGEGTYPRREHKREELRLVRLALEYGDGNGMEVELLRSLAWLEESRAAVTGMVRLDLPDVGVSGWARVQAVEDCPELEEGEGPLVTGWFKRRSSEVYDLVVEGETDSIGITERHPVWSVDRQAWVSAIELREGERLLAEDGSTPRMVSLSLRPGREPVYNIEVEGEHCYRVGQHGLLVHNQSAPTWCTNNTAGYQDVMPQITLFLRRQLTAGFIQNAPRSQLTVTQLPVTNAVNAVLKIMPGQGVGGGVLALFTDSQYYITNYNPAASDADLRMAFQDALNAGPQPAISAGHSSDTVGHIIGQQFGGGAGYASYDPAPRIVVNNVFPQSSNSQGLFNQIETMWSQSVGAGNKVCVTIRLVYSVGAYRPGAILVEWWETCPATGVVVHHTPPSIPN